MSDKIREAFRRIYPKIADGVRPSAFSIFKEGYEAGVALAQQPAPAVPEGWKLVPVEPTIDMEDAGRKAASGFMRLGEAGRVFRAMLAASPAAPAPAPAAQEPMAFYWQDLYAFPMTARRHGPYFGWPSEDAIARCQHYAKPVPLYAAPPAAEQQAIYKCPSCGAAIEPPAEWSAQVLCTACGKASAATAACAAAEQPDTVTALTVAARDVLAERRRQVEAEGWTPEHDDSHESSGLAAAAGCYAMYTLAYPTGEPPPAWPWDKSWWKPGDERRNRVKAAALLLAEIERMDRALLGTEGA